ncbi:MAG: NAD(+)/NADH kinase [Verrucomicrobiota bacterium]
MKIGIVANVDKAGAIPFLQEIISLSKKYSNLSLTFETKTASLIRKRGLSLAKLSSSCHLILVAGGDGSLLGVARAVYPKQIPILGINLGRLGFLTSVRKENLAEAFDKILHGKTVQSPRNLLEVYLQKENRFLGPALNDVVVVRGESSKLVHIRVTRDKTLVTEYRSDGLIVSTPTGSTAYSLSAGGPIITPETDLISLTPICPHTLTNRSLIMSPEGKLLVDIVAPSATVTVQVDGEILARLKPGEGIRIQKGKKRILLAYLEGYDFFEILREKLKWSGTSI